MNKMLVIPARKNAPQTKLHVEIVCQNQAKLGKRPIVFILPGGPGADGSFYKSYSCLLDVADIVYHDPRGCGLSAKGDPKTYNMHNYIDDVEVIRERLGFDDVIILGKSYGAMSAVGYALRYQQHIKKLILSAGAPSFRFIKTAQQNVKEVGTAEQVNTCKKLWKGSFANAQEVAEYFKIMEPLYCLKVKTKQIASTFRKIPINYKALNLGFRDFLRKFDYEPDLPKIKCPTLILAGEKDWITDARHSKLMAERIPNSKLKIFKNSSHAMEIDVEKQYFAEIRKFIIKT